MYTEYPPCALLSPYIDKYWEFKGNPGRGRHIHILPDGCTDFIFTLGEVADASDNKRVMQPYRSFFVGPMNKYSELVTCSETVYMMGVRFLPGGLSRFMHLPLHELTNQRINTDDLNSLFDHSFTAELCEQPDLNARISSIETLLIKALSRGNETDPRINFAIALINRYQGKQAIRSILEEVCLCQRQFEREFKILTGYTPKAYSRIIKFQHAVDLLKQAHPDTLLTIAVDTGYYDSAHLANEIKTLSGKPASAFFNLNLPKEFTLTYV